MKFCLRVHQFTQNNSKARFQCQRLKIVKSVNYKALSQLVLQIPNVSNSVLRSPSVMGILVADRKFFGEIGSLDGGMKIYGGENVELGIRVRFFGCDSDNGTFGSFFGLYALKVSFF